VIGEILLNLGDAVQAQGEYDAARARYKEALARFERTRSEPGILRAHAGLGQTALAVNDHQAATQHYRQALEMAVETHFDPRVYNATLRLYVVVGIAALLACTNVERAVELAALSQSHPSSTAEIRRRAQELLDHIHATLAPVAFVEARERGRSRDLEATIRTLLGEL
jgi:tetratricopeptide (TPR) repeat protein